MLTLAGHGATPEQLPIISGTRMGIEVIRGAAGSGKTTTAILRLESLAHTFEARRARLDDAAPVRVLVLTFNRTLAGYVEELARSQLGAFANVDCKIETCGSWAWQTLGRPTLIQRDERDGLISALGANINLPPDFLLDEIEYVCGRFPSSNLDDYLAAERTGRGATPQVTRATRTLIIELIRGLQRQIRASNRLDWDMLTEMMTAVQPIGYDIVIVDEAQDFSANQIRAINHHLSDPYCLTLVMDTAQRLYPRGFTWAESGLSMQAAQFHRLRTNHRNTVEIAAFSAGIIQGLRLDDDGTMPDLASATRHGTKPMVVKGLYQDQLNFATEWIRANVDLRTETVAFLKPLGGGWFKEVRAQLEQLQLPYVEVTRDREWPQGPENIALSTMHSAKGLEFDHVIILGLSGRNTQHGEGDDDDSLLVLRRLLAMAVARARKSVIVGYKPAEASNLVRYFSAGTFVEHDVARKG